MAQAAGQSGAGEAPLMLSISGCRGIFGQTMTPEVAARFAMVLGGYVRERWLAAGRSGKPLVVMGRDGRASGQIIAQGAAAGLAASGCNVLDLGVAMTATVGVMADDRGAAGGLVITASHNPQQWNGLKPMVREVSGGGGGGGARGEMGEVSACAPDAALADAVISRYHEAKARGVRGVNVGDAGAIEAAPSGQGMGLWTLGTFTHVSKVKSAMKSIGVVDDRRMMGVKCVVDSVNASGVEGARALLGERIRHHLGSSDNGLFPHTPEPLKENLVDLARCVAEKKADVGFAQDPDADRLAIIDERGEYIGEEYTLVLAAESLLGSGVIDPRGAVLCTNLSTSRMIEDVAARHGARVIRTPVGEANVVDAMKQHGAVLGGEGNGGVIWPRVTYIRDSLSAMALVLALIGRTGRSVSQIVADMPRYAIVKRKVDLADTSAAKRAAEAVANCFKGERIDRRDGVRVDFDRLPKGQGPAWIHVRGSNTEPIMRLIAEAPTKQDAEAILDEAARAIG